MRKQRVLAGLDVGSTKITAVLAEIRPDAKPEIVASHTVPSRGVQRGTVVDLDAAAMAVEQAIRGVASQTRRQIDLVTVGTSAPVASLNNRGSATPALPDQSVTAIDVRRAVVAAGDPGLPPSRQVLNAIPRRFCLDGQSDVSNPIGLFAHRIDADVHIVTVGGLAIRSLIAAVERSGVEIEATVPQPLAAAEAVLTPEERDLGVVVADIGAGSTGVSVFVDGTPWHTATIPIGGRHITQDVATVLGIATDVAEELKLSAGDALAGGIALAEAIEVPLVDGDTEVNVGRRDLCEIIEARVLELIGLIGEEIRRSGYSGLLPGGLVLTGGTSQLPNIARAASEALQLRVRIGQPPTLAAAELRGPAHAGALGLILWTLRAPSRHYWTYPARAGLLAGQNRPEVAASISWRSWWPRIHSTARRSNTPT